MPSLFNPFSGIGKIAGYIRWSSFRGIAKSVIQSRAVKKFGARWRTLIQRNIQMEIVTERTARSLTRLGMEKQLTSLTLPTGKNKAKTVRISGQIRNSKFKGFGSGKNSRRAFVIDVPRGLTKRQMQKSIRDQILEAFFEHYDIPAKYKGDFRRRFGEIDLIDVEGV